MLHKEFITYSEAFIKKPKKSKRKMTAAEKSLLDTQPKTKKVIKYIPPDGGWGWMVIAGTAASNVSTF